MHFIWNFVEKIYQTVHFPHFLRSTEVPSIKIDPSIHSWNPLRIDAINSTVNGEMQLSRWTLCGIFCFH